MTGSWRGSSRDSFKSGWKGGTGTVVSSPIGGVKFSIDLVEALDKDLCGVATGVGPDKLSVDALVRKFGVVFLCLKVVG